MRDKRGARAARPRRLACFALQPFDSCAEMRLCCRWARRARVRRFAMVSTAPDYRCPSGKSAPRQGIRDNSRAHPFWQQQQGSTLCVLICCCRTLDAPRCCVADLSGHRDAEARAHAHPGGCPAVARCICAELSKAACHVCEAAGPGGACIAVWSARPVPGARFRYRLSSATLMTQGREAGKVGTYRGSALVSVPTPNPRLLLPWPHDRAVGRQQGGG